MSEISAAVIRGNDQGKKMEKDEGTTTTRIRIFVGGLGESVKEEDMEQIFKASLGKVKSIDFIRTKGRSFAYLDFLPSSPKSLPKLFSTYNGCVWKGGRLKLEKAKEHYLVRLKREWEEDAELLHCAPSSGVDADKSIASSQSSNKVLKSEKMQLQIFFPKLQKVKSLPFSGTGKHKYSFQRVEVPLLPIHFCDCEEHYVPPHTAKKNHLCDLEEQSGGINEEELNLMNSVMNKLLERENNSQAASSGAELVKEGDSSLKSINDPLLDDSEATDEEDEDNLIINMVTRGKERMTLSGSPEKEKMEKQLDTQESKFNQLQVSKGEPNRDMLKVHEREVVSSSKKRKVLNCNEYDRTGSVSRILKRLGGVQTHARDADILLEPPRLELGFHQSTISPWSQKSSWKQLVGDKGINVFSISHVLPGGSSREEEQHSSSGQNKPNSIDSKSQDLSNHGIFGGQSDQSKVMEELAEAQPSNATNRSARGASWLQKCSWTQLVSETNNSFSISQILPGTAFEKTELPKSKSLDVASVTDRKHCNLVQHNTNDSSGDSIRSMGHGEGLLTAPSVSNIVASHTEQNSNALNVEQGTEENMEAVRISNEVSAPAPVKNDHSAPKRTSIGDMGIAGTCSFMRSAASVREWANTKAVLSGSAKRKHSDK